jgi:hypothetical protein
MPRGTGNIWIMLLIPGLIALAILVGFLLGGSLRRFEDLEIHRWGLALVGLGLHLAAMYVVVDKVAGPVVLALSYAFLIAFLVWNRWIPAAWVMVAGLLLNLVVVVANGGMPVDPNAVQAIGGDTTSLELANDGAHHLMTAEDVFWRLGDTIGVPAPVSAVVSIGDVLLYGAIGYSIVQIMRGRCRENPRPLAWWWLGYRGKHAPEYWRMPIRYRSPDRAAAGRSGTEP